MVASSKKKKKITKPKIYQKQSQKQATKVSIHVDNSKKDTKSPSGATGPVGPRKATTTQSPSPSPSAIYLGNTQAPQPFPYYFPVEKNSSLPEVATNVSNTLLGQKLGEAPKNMFETFTQMPEPKKPRKTPSEATTERIPEKPEKKINKQTTMTDFYKFNLKRKPEREKSTSSTAPVPWSGHVPGSGPVPKKPEYPEYQKYKEISLR
jgi:hypothetical protein